MIRNSVVAAIIMIFIGCETTEANNNVTNQVINKAEVNSLNEEVQSMYKYTHVEPVQINLDDMPFSEAFRIQHHAKGAGHMFWWKGKEYTTNLYAETVPENGRWVSNSDDKDDSCYYNAWDECGICNGSGPSTWYLDEDGDGLGDPNVWVQECSYPNE